MSGYFKAPTNKRDAPGFSQHFVFLCASTYDKQITEAISGLSLYEFTVKGQLVKVLASPLREGMTGRVQTHVPA